MKLLLTSGGIRNPAIESALLDLLGRPVAECTALAIPTGTYGHASCNPTVAWNFLTGRSTRMCDLGWKSVGVLELTALPSIGRDRWEPWVREADVILCDGGDATYLAHWMRETGLADMLPELDDTVWVGLSAGSMVLTPRIGPDFVTWDPPSGDDRTLGLVDFAIFPHLEQFPTNTVADAERWAADLGIASYAMDDACAITVVDGETTMIGDGLWRHFPAAP